MEETIVSIALITYNHGKYVRQAIESILMQKVDFKYEIIVGDDCSLDDTREIINDYYNKYENIFKPILRSTNIGAMNNMYDILIHCTGRYIATLEGDDFWVDKFKLQKQVNYLENNSQYIGVAHKTIVVDYNCKKQEDDTYMNYNGIFQMNEYLKIGLAFHTSSLVYRNIFKNSSNRYHDILTVHPIIGDATLAFVLLDLGNIFIIDKVMSAWRYVVSPNGSNFNSIAIRRPVENMIESIILHKAINEYFKGKYDFSDRIKDRVVKCYILIIRNNVLKNISNLNKLMSMLTLREKFESFGYFFYYIINRIFRKVKGII